MAEQTDASRLYADVAVSQRMAERTVDEVAAFLLSRLKPGMSILDAGCGPGSITLGLAQAVAPGQVIGVDIEAAQVERAAAAAAAHHIDNVRFEVGSAYDLPVADGSLDAVFAHAVVVHLEEPLRALREYRRVLKPGGVAAVREYDTASFFFEPPTLELEALVSLVDRYWTRNLPHVRNLRTLLAEAGFAETEALAWTRFWGSRETIPKLVSAFEGLLRSADLQQTALEHGWADAEALESMLKELGTWAQRPDAFCAHMAFAALGWPA